MARRINVDIVGDASSLDRAFRAAEKEVRRMRRNKTFRAGARRFREAAAYGFGVAAVYSFAEWKVAAGAFAQAFVLALLLGGAKARREATRPGA